MLKDEIIEEIQGSTKTKSKLSYELGVSVSTIERWLRDRDEQLTLLRFIEVVQEELGYSELEDIIKSK